MLWNHRNGIVFAGFRVPSGTSSEGIPHIIEVSITGPNPLVDSVRHFTKWAPIEITFEGPESQGKGEPNPFSISLDVLFNSPSGARYRVPGFYDGDGQGGLDGNVWKVRYSADETGRWKYISQSDNPRLDGHTGEFIVSKQSEDAPGFYRWGRLEYTGTAANKLRYLKFRDGPYWLKAGCDDPENFLGGYDNYNTPAKRKTAIDYLAGRGINSLYIMTHNLARALEFMRKLDQIDPYDHPRGIHNVNLPSDQYIDATQADFTSIQTGAHGTLSGLDKALAHHRTTLDWIERCRQRGRRTLVINFDEGRPEEDRRAWWSAYMAGGVWEAHVLEPYDRPMSA